MIVAVGIGCDGRKTVLGIREGATENAAVRQASFRAIHDDRFRLPTSLSRKAFPIGICGSTIQNVRKSVPVGEEDARASFPDNVGHHGNLSRVEVKLVVRRKLIMPFELPRVCVERDQRTPKQVIASSRRTVPVGPGISDAPANRIEVGTKRSGGPDGPGGGDDGPGLTVDVEPELVAARHSQPASHASWRRQVGDAVARDYLRSELGTAERHSASALSISGVG